MSDLIQRIDAAIKRITSGSAPMRVPAESSDPDLVLSECKSALKTANARIADLEQELRNIANADTVEWDDPTQFEAWAKSRARHTLNKQQPQEQQA